MKIEYALPFRRTPEPLGHAMPPDRPPTAPRIARLVALAHRLDELVRSGAIGDYAALARLGHITPGRLTQLMVLLHLSPAIQEDLLFISSGNARFIAELKLRRIAREPHWDRQRAMFEQLFQVGR